MRPVKVLIGCANAQADLNLRWAHRSEGTFLDVEALMFFLLAIWFLNLLHCIDLRSILLVALSLNVRQCPKAICKRKIQYVSL